MVDASTRRKVVWGLVILLGVIHYDFWNWSDRELFFGFMPVGLLFHAMISLAAGLTWALVVKFAWPTWIEEWAEAGVSDEADGS